MRCGSGMSGNSSKNVDERLHEVLVHDGANVLRRSFGQDESSEVN